MAAVELNGVTKMFGAVGVLDGIDLAIADGEFVVFVGPSGCGKSTLLRLIAGLEAPSAGTIAIGGRVVNDLEPAERGIAMVFQSYALYPHMSVRDNLGFALKLQGKPRAEIAAAVEAAAATLDIAHLLDRKPKALSGGQRQRVAIGRAIVRQPSAFLFDEPLSNLDAALRQRMRYEFAQLHDQLGATMIYVTHDQIEAMTLADRIVVLSAGRIEQIGTPAELYDRPATRFVAGFIGAPQMNFLPVTATAEGKVRLADGTVIATGIDLGGIASETPLTLGIRPEHVVIGGAVNRIEAPVAMIESLGASHFAYLSTPGGEPLACQLAEQPHERPGRLAIALPPERCHLFDESGQALRNASATTASSQLAGIHETGYMIE
ncbi:ABC transporter ATP-binding protein [Hephaestia mangrovi]|uniref:ABC transporter ATP-binding protein n=1 Tax=Hephaestia mangrovi TaxID=2873268 RepID=UPI001CA79AF0|nr:sn-glycerol-3-phosphate ABC transporter ATP-binding protein UgpC [Hephaestia mangrovi]MBY8828402.1 sn-glycerol-3-phosphate ABC transporter ATP-binding protein UgpC [Hephaestia mangrovi]